MQRSYAQLLAAVSRVFSPEPRLPLPLQSGAPPRIIHVVALGDSFAERAKNSGLRAALSGLNPGYVINVVEESTALDVMQRHFPDYLAFYKTLQGSWRSDLVRYFIMFLHGGVYIDLDLQPLLGFDALLERLRAVVAARREHSSLVRRVFCIGARKILPYEGANGFMIAPAGDTIFLDLAKTMMQQANQEKDLYGANVKRFYDTLSTWFPAISAYTAVDDTFFLQEVEVERMTSTSPSYTINVLPEEPVMLSNGWAGVRWPDA